MTLAAEIDANLRIRLRLHADAWPGGQWTEHGGMLLTRLTGAPHLQAGVAGTGTGDPFTAAQQWYGEEPFTLWLPGSPAVDGAEVVEEITGMAVPVEEITRRPSPVVVRNVDDDATRREFRSLAEGFGLARESVERLFPVALLQRGTALVGSVDGVPVSACWTVDSGTVAGVYGVITAAAVRRHGYATAVLARAAELAAERGRTHLVLQTANAASTFGAMGFTEVSRYVVVAPAYWLS